MTVPDGPSDIVALFPHPAVPPPHAPGAKPTYSRIKATIAHLSANAAAVRTPLGDGRLGHLGLIIGPAEYAAISAGNAAWIAPADPGPNPILPNGATNAQIAELRRQHTNAVKVFQTYHDTDAALKAQLIAATDAQYIAALKHGTYGFAQRTTLELLNHLRTTYGTIRQTDLDANDERMQCA